MPNWIRDSGGRLVKRETPHNKELELSLNIMEATPEDQHSHHGHQDNPNAFRSMRDRMHPPCMSAPSCIVPPIEQLVIRPHIVPLLPTFHGMESENPYAHIKEFEDVCNTFQEGGASIDLMRLKLFPFTLKDKAKIWLNYLRPRSIRTWTNLQAEFLKKFFPTHRTNGLKRLTNLNTVQKKGRFPSQPHQNPKGIHEVETKEGESSQVRDVKALITLRSGKKVKLPTPKPHVEEEEEEETKKREEIKEKKKDISEGKEDHDSTVNANPEKLLIKKEMMKKHTPPPFSQALHGKKGIRNASEILEVLRQVKVNIPLLDMIKQVPTYAKFLKDLCTIKRGLNVNKKAFLTEQVSAIIQCKSPVKYKDLRCPTISVMIGGKVVEKALLDLGASVNLLPNSVYKQLGLGELKPTSIIYL
ncbi:hypothetical protein VitviT2T_011697 [Vitis vinifera]|uniref:Retrotransposon gag domain-containing protein n=1 Tax=Vitis vinifera TaxID=29760 RepID=A0ABY9CBK1_VITVI|nr:hypothetical protein VitviT2T_011697 [Vitis vinifera]